MPLAFYRPLCSYAIEKERKGGEREIPHHVVHLHRETPTVLKNHEMIIASSYLKYNMGLFFM